MVQLDDEFMQNVLDTEVWKTLSAKAIWTETLLEKCQEQVDWDELSENSEILWTIPMLQQFQNFLDWDTLSEHINKDSLTLELIEAFEDRWNWYNLSNNYDFILTDEILKKYANHLNWERIINRSTYIGVAPFDDNAIDFYNKYKEFIPLSKLQDSQLWDCLLEERKLELWRNILS